MPVLKRKRGSGWIPEGKRIVTELIQILQDAGKPEAVDEETKIGDTIEAILPAVNSKFFPNFCGFRDCEIEFREMLGELESEVLELR